MFKETHDLSQTTLINVFWAHYYFVVDTPYPLSISGERLQRGG